MIFRKFSNADVSSIGPVKSSIVRAIRASLCEQYPYLEETGLIDDFVPKKGALNIAKCHGHIQVLLRDGEPVFFTTRDGPWCPELHLVHQYPDMMRKLRVDQGAIKFVLAGANIMCPGLTSEGATMHDEADKGQAVSIYAQDKENALAVGVMMMSTEEVRKSNKGHGVENLHFVSDGLWSTRKLG